MNSGAKPLSFAAVDELAFAATTDVDFMRWPAKYEPRSLGPLFELLHLLTGRRVSDPNHGRWLRGNGAETMISALRAGRESWLDRNRRLGFVRAIRVGENGDLRFDAFLMDAMQAARDITKLPGTTPQQLVAAVREMESNIHEHSDAPATGLVAFRAAPGSFEFVAADQGIGVLRSLRTCTNYSGLSDHGAALELALREGTSRYDATEPGRGKGFRDLFRGLLNLNGLLRFRSGDQALTMDGTSPSLATAALAQKPEIDGLFVSVKVLAPHRMGFEGRGIKDVI